jgi:hypothetical protein
VAEEDRDELEQRSPDAMPVEPEQPAGFELDGRFYRWRAGDTGKDLLLIDRFAALPVNEFFEVVQDKAERARAPIFLALMATSIRAEHPTWTIDRIVRIVINTSLGDVVVMGEDDDDDEAEADGDGDDGGDDDDEAGAADPPTLTAVPPADELEAEDSVSSAEGS